MFVFYLYFIILYNTTGMSHLKIIRVSRGFIHKYENLKKNGVVFTVFHLYFIILYNTTGMSHLKIIRDSRGFVQKYENLKKN